MTGRQLLVAAAVMWMAALSGVGVAAHPQVRSPLPPGPERETVITICGDCHGPEVIANQRRSRVEWETLVEDMAARNGVASEDEKKLIVAYALRNFGKVNVNSASAEDIAQIVEIPAKQAAAIVDYRQTAGEFKTLEDLRKVPGLDFAPLQERKDRIGFTGP